MMIIIIIIIIIVVVIIIIIFFVLFGLQDMRLTLTVFVSLLSDSVLFIILSIMNPISIAIHKDLYYYHNHHYYYYYYQPRMREGNVFSRVCLSVCLFVCLSVCLCVSVCVCPAVQALTFECLELRT